MLLSLESLLNFPGELFGGIDRHGDELKKRFARREVPLWDVVAFVDGCNVFAGDGLQTLVREIDEVLFLSPISGDTNSRAALPPKRESALTPLNATRKGRATRPLSTSR